ncbi:hypothetical protein JIG36_05275 [Actinoplanes sp. LDG1-06]|uniref:Uncharacterized protein n=1 Tax=Paractinoplanes ovalisporus TaxID=2810368 RepID=A0ABS2A550_9ACTN|nr:hypothetical protein [Actinoplanes ovalisporus]MBM2614970.1 hypothetical protein [Actinoplanes ovalisporus]
MADQQFAETYSLTLPTSQAAHAVADELARRGHRLVAVRVVDHFILDPTSWWYGKPSIRPEFAGWWDVFSVLDDLSLRTGEGVALQDIARRHGGVASGPGGGHVATVLTTFTRVGLVHELTDGEVIERRAALAAVDPAVFVGGTRSLRSAPPLASRATPDEQAEMAAIAELLDADEIEDVEWEDAGEMLGELFDGAMHQGTCYPHTAGTVPGFVTLALDDRLGDKYRAWVLLDLFLIATVGRRDLCAQADTLRALGRPAIEAPEAVAARRAVAEALPRLFDRWDWYSEASQFFLLGLAAACPAAGASVQPAIARRREADHGTDREPTVRLMEALIDGDSERIEAALRDVAVRTDSPYATPEQRGLDALDDLLVKELSR